MDPRRSLLETRGGELLSLSLLHLLCVPPAGFLCCLGCFLDSNGPFRGLGGCAMQTQIMGVLLSVICYGLRQMSLHLVKVL